MRLLAKNEEDQSSLLLIYVFKDVELYIFFFFLVDNDSVSNSVRVYLQFEVRYTHHFFFQKYINLIPSSNNNKDYLKATALRGLELNLLEGLCFFKLLLIQQPVLVLSSSLLFAWHQIVLYSNSVSSTNFLVCFTYQFESIHLKRQPECMSKMQHCTRGCYDNISIEFVLKQNLCGTTLPSLFCIYWTISLQMLT